MPVRLSYTDELSRDKYGTDVPTLYLRVERLERKLKHREEVLSKREKELKELKRSIHVWKVAYGKLYEIYERKVEALREEKKRWRRRR